MCHDGPAACACTGGVTITLSAAPLAAAGTASQFVIMRAVGAVVGGLCGLVCMYVTYWINGSSYERSATKGAVMVTLLSALSFVLGLYRFRLPRWWFAFCVATFRCGGWAAGACRGACRGAEHGRAVPPALSSSLPQPMPLHTALHTAPWPCSQHAHGGPQPVPPGLCGVQGGRAGQRGAFAQCRGVQ